MKKHRFNIFPIMQSDDYNRLKDDLGRNGYDPKNPIYTYEGEILDGWNRYCACAQLHITPEYKIFTGDDYQAIDFVMRTNKRRNLNSSQWAIIANEAEEMVKAIRDKVEEERIKKISERDNVENQHTKKVEIRQLIDESATISKLSDQPQHGPVVIENKPMNSSQWAVFVSDNLELVNQKGKEIKTLVEKVETVQLIVPSPKDNTRRSDQIIAKSFNTNRTYINEAAKLKRDHPELVEQVKSGKKTIPQIRKEIVKQEREFEIKQLAERVTNIDEFESICTIKHCDFKILLPTIKPDVILTDPPYPKEFLYVYEELAELSKSVPIVAIMCGQSYLPEIYSMMSKHLKYRWTLCYLTPGGQSVQLWQYKVNTFWKPILLFGESVSWIGDVTKSDTNDNDKNHHHWGQSESGMVDLINRLSKPNDTIFDPFMGAGTTGVAALRCGRKFIGCDIDSSFVEKSIERCKAEFQK